MFVIHWVLKMNVSHYTWVDYGRVGLIELIDVWSRLVSEDEVADWVLVFAGPDYRGFQSILQNKIDANHLSDRIKIVGPCYGNKVKYWICVNYLFYLHMKSV